MTTKRNFYEENGYLSKLALTLHTMRMRDVGCNCEIIVGKDLDKHKDCFGHFTATGIDLMGKKLHRIPAHYEIVAAASEYCRKYARKQHSRYQYQILITAEMERNNIEQCIDFMYTGRVGFNCSSAMEIAALSNILKVEGLKLSCFDFLWKNLTVESCASAIKLARSCQLIDYEKRAIRFWLKSQANDSSNLAHEHLWHSAMHLNQTSSAFGEICSIKGVLEAIGTEHLSVDFLLEKVVKHIVVRRDCECQTYVSKTICKKAEQDVRIITETNCFLIRNVFKKYKYQFPILKQNLNAYLVKNFENMSQKEEFVQLDNKEFFRIIESPELLCSSEETKLNVILNWVKDEGIRYHKSFRNWFANSILCERLDVFPKLFRMISLKDLPIKVIQNLNSEPLITRRPELQRLLREAECAQAVLRLTESSARSSSVAGECCATGSAANTSAEVESSETMTDLKECDSRS